MKKKALIVVALLSVTAVGAGPAVQALNAPRDLTEYQTAVQAEATASATWESEVGETDQATADRDAAQAALDAAQAALDAQVAEESTALTALNDAMTATKAALDAVPTP